MQLNLWFTGITETSEGENETKVLSIINSKLSIVPPLGRTQDNTARQWTAIVWENARSSVSIMDQVKAA